MSNGWNRKERYMLEKDNMTKHIKFLSYWVKTTRTIYRVLHKDEEQNKYNKKTLNEE